MANNSRTIATAYVQIKPSMEGIQGELTQAFGGEGDSAGSAFSKGFGGAIKAASGAAVAAIGAATTAAGAMTKQAVEGYAEYEQLVGGVETLFGTQGLTLEEYAKTVGKTTSEVQAEYTKLQSAQDNVFKNASDAYKNAGMSANEYMTNVTSFAASLVSSLDGDTVKAANLADQAIVDMSDNANKMGSSIESIQNAYQGFAKQNYTMLDNLKLGYGGTKQEMERLLEDAQKLSGVEYSMDSFADIIDAIHVIQEEMGVAGTTEKEAAETISGSIAMTKSAWDNLIVGLADGDADLGGLIDNLVNSATAAFDNLLPVIEQAMLGIGSFVEKIAPVLMQEIPGLLNNVLPELLNIGISVVGTIGQGILENLPSLIEMGMQAILNIVNGLAAAMPTLIPAVVDVVLTIVTTLLDNIDLLVDAAIALQTGLADGLIAAMPILLERAPEIIEKLVAALIENLPKLIEAALQLMLALTEGIMQNLPLITQSALEIIGALISGCLEQIPAIIDMCNELFGQMADFFFNADSESWGADMIQGLIDGIKSMIGKVADAASEVAAKIASYLHFSAPDVGPLAEYEKWMPDFMKGLAKGIDKNKDAVSDAITGVASDMVISPTMLLNQTLNGVAETSPAYAGTPQAMSFTSAGNSDTLDILSKYLPIIAENGGTNVSLEGDAAGIFNLVRKQNSMFTRANGRSAFA